MSVIFTFILYRKLIYGITAITKVAQSGKYIVVASAARGGDADSPEESASGHRKQAINISHDFFVNLIYSTSRSQY